MTLKNLLTLPPFDPIVVLPSSSCYELALTADTAISHHDAARQNDSNRTLFNRQKQLLARSVANVLPTQAQMDRVTLTFPVPEESQDLLSMLTFPQFVGTALVKLFLDMFNQQDGAGIFSGMERYERLRARAEMGAVVAPTLWAWWNYLCKTLQVPMHGGDDDAKLFTLLALPSSVQQLTLRVLADDSQTMVALARYWHQTVKAMSERYAAVAGIQQASSRLVSLTYQPDGLPATSDKAAVVEVPTISGNSLRHQVVREPSWLHLCRHLGIRENEPGKGQVPPGVEAIFYNGGNIAANAKQPENTFGLARQVRALYPSLDLLGGVADSFDLGESRLRVAAWLVCRENLPALVGSPVVDHPAASVSVFDLLDDVTLTRQAGQVGTGQMIMSFETLCAGAEVLLRLVLPTFTPELTRGALVAAVETFLVEDGTIGGQAARGFGHVRGEWVRRPADLADQDLREDYEVYLHDHKQLLLDGLTSGMLGTGHRILT